MSSPNRGADLSQVQDVLGHADPSTTKMVYAHYTPQKLRPVVLEYSASPAELVAEFEAEAPHARGAEHAVSQGGAGPHRKLEAPATD